MKMERVLRAFRLKSLITIDPSEYPFLKKIIMPIKGVIQMHIYVRTSIIIQVVLFQSIFVLITLFIGDLKE